MIKHYTWKKLWTRDYAVQYFYMPLVSLGIRSDLTPHPIEDILVTPEKNMRSIFVPREAFEAYLRDLRARYLDDLGYFEKFTEEFSSGAAALLGATQAAAGDLSNLTKNELIGRHASFMESWQTYGAYLWITFYLNELLADDVAQRLGEIAELDASQKTELREYAARPSAASGVLLLAEESLSRTPEELLERFRWLSTLDIHSDPLTLVDMQERLIQGPSLHREPPECLNGLNAVLRRLIACAREAAHIKDVRDDFRRKMVLNVLPLFEAIAAAVHVPRKELSYLTNEEIYALLRSDADGDSMRSVAQKRIRDGFLLRLANGRVLIVDDVTAIRGLLLKEGIESESDPVPTDAIRGIAGSKGSVRGKVVVVHGVGEIGKVTEGDILCTVTTNPDYLPAMRKAAAIVTDEGGITCHAAIVAREMKKPCIIGTKIATQVLKDGDMVEVDADSGTVRKLVG